MSCATDSSGKMYTWGFGGSKRLGHGSCSNELVPRVLQALASVHVTRVTCGHLHVAAVTSIGSVFTWGDGDFGKLGHGNTLSNLQAAAHSCRRPGNVDSVSIPTFCRNLREAIVDVACGRDHTLALSSTGILFAWGSNKDGRLGVGHTQTLYEPNMCVHSRYSALRALQFIVFYAQCSHGRPCRNGCGSRVGPQRCRHWQPCVHVGERLHGTARRRIMPEPKAGA